MVQFESSRRGRVLVIEGWSGGGNELVMFTSKKKKKNLKISPAIKCVQDLIFV